GGLEVGWSEVGEFVLGSGSAVIEETAQGDDAGRQKSRATAVSARGNRAHIPNPFGQRRQRAAVNQGCETVPEHEQLVTRGQENGRAAAPFAPELREGNIPLLTRCHLDPVGAS